MIWRRVVQRSLFLQLSALSCVLQCLAALPSLPDVPACFLSMVVLACLLAVLNKRMLRFSALESGKCGVPGECLSPQLL